MPENYYFALFLNSLPINKLLNCFYVISVRHLLNKVKKMTTRVYVPLVYKQGEMSKAIKECNQTKNTKIMLSMT